MFLSEPHSACVKLQEKGKQEEFKLALENRFQPLSELLDEEIGDINNYWVTCKEALETTCEEVLGRKTYAQKDWISGT